jgi:hypothetical protein
MTPDEIQEAYTLLRNLPPKDILYRTLFGECRGEPIEAQVGVGSVLRNRVNDHHHRWPNTYNEVALQPAQFSCFNPQDPNFEKLLDPERHEKLEVLEQLKWIAHGIVQGLIQENVAGANHYYDFSIIVGRGLHRDPKRLPGYLQAVDLIVDPTISYRNDDLVGRAREHIHTLVAPLPPAWDNEVLPVARKGRLVFFRL